MKRIIYPNDDGGVSVIYPSPNTKYTIEEIALKDVPKGKPYRIIEQTDVPTDGTFRNAWEYDFGTLDNVDGFGLGSEGFFNQGLGD